MKVSIIIPTYNRSTLIKETIDSVLKQTFRDFELIVVDDGSTDDTEQVISTYGDAVHYVKQSNHGVNHARNRGLSLAQGEYIATLDNDDLWLPYKLELQVQILDKLPDVAFTFSNFAIYKSADRITPDGIQTWYQRPMDWNTFYERTQSLSNLTDLGRSFNFDDCKLHIGDIYHASLHNFFVLPSAALFRKSLIPQGQIFAEHDPICGDWEYFARMSQSHPVAYLDHETTLNRSHEDEVRLTRTNWKKQLELRVDLIERLYMQDESFYAKHKKEVDSLYRSRLKALYRQQLLDGEHKAVTCTLERYKLNTVKFDPVLASMSVLNGIPGISPLARTIRKARSRLSH